MNLLSRLALTGLTSLFLDREADANYLNHYCIKYASEEIEKSTSDVVYRLKFIAVIPPEDAEKLTGILFKKAREIELKKYTKFGDIPLDRKDLYRREPKINTSNVQEFTSECWHRIWNKALHCKEEPIIIDLKMEAEK